MTLFAWLVTIGITSHAWGRIIRWGIEHEHPTAYQPPVPAARALKCPAEFDRVQILARLNAILAEHGKQIELVRDIVVRNNTPYAGVHDHGPIRLPLPGPGMKVSR